MLDAGRAPSRWPSWPRARNPQFPNVPTLKEAIGVDYSVGAWRGIAAPKGLPAPITERFVSVLKKISDSKDSTSSWRPAASA